MASRASATLGATLAGVALFAAVRRVEIPKPDGGVRQLGIPTVLDRFIQQAVLQVLQGQWDATFSMYSYGFRPQRSAHQAVDRLLAVYHSSASGNWVHRKPIATNISALGQRPTSNHSIGSASHSLLHKTQALCFGALPIEPRFCGQPLVGRPRTRNQWSDSRKSSFSKARRQFIWCHVVVK